MNLKNYSYAEKQSFLSANFKQISAPEFYRDLFPVGSFERPNMAEGKPNGIVWCDLNGHVRTSLFYDDLERLWEKSAAAFYSWLAPVGFYGKKPTSKNASLLFAMAFDLDGVGKKQISALFSQIKIKVLPQPTYVVNSGNGVHLFYVFEKPIPLYPQVHERLNLLKRNLTKRIWNPYTSDLKEKQFQGVVQGFRTVGTKTKAGDITTCFRTGEKITVEYLNEWATDEAVKVTDFKYKSTMSLQEAKEKFPEWYERRVVQGDTSGGGAWHPKGNPRALYEWWIRQIRLGAAPGHRYWCVYAMVVYGRKCGVPLEEIRADAYGLVEILNSLNPDDPFTKKDVRDALKAYQESNYKVSRQFISEQTAIEIKANKRNGRSQTEHVKLMNFVREEINGNKDWRNKDGRPSYREAVFKFLDMNPEATAVEFCELTNMSRAVFFKYKKEWLQKQNEEYKAYRNRFAIASIFDGCVKDAQTGESLNLAELITGVPVPKEPLSFEEYKKQMREEK